MNTEIKKRENEWSAVYHRELFERVPDGVNPLEWKVFRENYNRAANLEDNDAPAQLDIELNSTCNLKCSFCIQSVRDLGKNKLGFECFTRLIDEAVKNGTKSLKLNYMNEPLIVQDLEKYIKYAKDAGMVNVFMSTNGIMLTEKRAKTLIESGITKIFISLDAFTSETYEKQRHSKKFDVITNNILTLVKIRNEMGLRYPLVRVNFLKNKINIHELNDFLDFWKDKVDMIIIQDMNELIDKESGIFIEPKNTDYKCSFPFKQLVIDARGRILPCCCMNGTELMIGNISDMTLKEAWNSDKIKELRKLHKSGKYYENEVCRRCITGK